MAKGINLLDRSPQAVFTALNWVLAPLENLVGLDRPRWMDSSRYQGDQDFSEQAANGVWGNVFRQGISWGYQDPTFSRNWGESYGRIHYRSSYHVIYPDQQVKPQFDNWIKGHPQIAIVPRVIDLELERSTPAAMIAGQVWEMSERVADNDGVRPIIYSRRLLINKWLAPYWSGVMLNEHYYWLAQYTWDRTREHAGPPTLPNGVDESRVILHQTADKKTTPSGEAESKSIDWDRWELGNPDQMNEWITDTWGGPPVDPDPEPEPDPELKERVNQLNTRVTSLEVWAREHDRQHEIPDTIQVKAQEQVALAVPAGHDRACIKIDPEADPPGKPIIDPPNTGRVVILKDAVVTVKARAAYSCKDVLDTPEIIGANGEFYVVAEGFPGAGQYLRKDKTVPA